MAKGIEFTEGKVNDNRTMGNVDTAFVDGDLILRIRGVGKGNTPLATKNGAPMYGASYATVKDPVSGIKVRLNLQAYTVTDKKALSDENEELRKKIAELEAAASK